MTMLAWHGKPELQAEALATMRKHREAETLVQNHGYWDGSKGCAVGCLIQSGRHAEYETRFGIPQILAHLEDAIFEGLPRPAAREWPERFLAAARPGADLSRVGWQFLHWLLIDPAVNPGIDHPSVRDAVRQCADALLPLAEGGPADMGAAWSAARSAALDAASAAWSAARSAALDAALDAESAALAASEVSAPRSAAYIRMADRLIDLMTAAGRQA